MRTIYQQHRFKNIPTTLVLFSAILFFGCSGYQSVSYYQDGIYGEAPMQEVPQQAVNTTEAPQQSGSYYKNYFAEKASQGIQDDYIFTNPEQYQSPAPEQTSAGNYQAHGSWGDQSDRINVNIIYNRPLGWNWVWGWYDAPYTFGRSAFWGYNYHPWYFTFDHYHNPYYNPYRWGWGYQGTYWNRWNPWNRWDNRYPYWVNRYHNGSVYRNTPTYSRIRGGRGESGITRSSSRSSNGQSANTERRQTNSRNNGSLRDNMRRSRNNNSYSTNSTQRQQRDATTTNSRSRSDNSYNQPNNNSSRSSNSSYSRTRSSSNNNFSRTSAGSRSSSSGLSSRSRSSTRR